MNSLGRASEDYLEAVLILEKQSGHVRSIDVANYLGVSKASVSTAMKALQKVGYITKRTVTHLELTEIGRKIAEQIYERHCFFTERLIAVGVEPSRAEADACKIEHVISAESFQILKDYYSAKVEG